MNTIYGMICNQKVFDKLIENFPSETKGLTTFDGVKVFVNNKAREGSVLFASTEKEYKDIVVALELDPDSLYKMLEEKEIKT